MFWSFSFYKKSVAPRVMLFIYYLEYSPRFLTEYRFLIISTVVARLFLILVKREIWRLWLEAFYREDISPE